MSYHKGDNKTALKLANKYADSCNILIQENKALKTEIKDLRANILINKQIIEGFFSKSSQTDKNKLIILKFQEENKTLYNQNELLNKELAAIHDKLIFLEHTYSETLNREKEENDSLKIKIFLIEQTLTKKNNIIRHLKKKAEPSHDDDSHEYEKEIYITHPHTAIVHINDELLMYKQIYSNLIMHVKESRESILKSEAIITELQKENSKLRLQNKYHLITANKEKETLLNAFQNERLSINTRHLTDNGSKYVTSQSNNNVCKTQILPKVNSNDYLLFKKLQLNNKNDNTKFENEDFKEILKIAGLYQSDFEKLAKIKTCTKLAEIIEMLYSLLKDKNMTLSVLKEENEKLTTKNFQLNKDNMILLQQNVEFKKQLVHDKATKNNKSNYGDSLSNNTSHITNVNHNISNAISTYHKLIKLEEKNSIDILNASAGVDSSRHDSIVYMKNMKEYDDDGDNDNEEVLKDNNDIVNDNDSNVRDMKIINTIHKTTDTNQINQYNQNIMTIESITSSEFRDGCKGLNSFISTVRDDNTIEKEINDRNNKSNNDKVNHEYKHKHKTDLNSIDIKLTNL